MKSLISRTSLLAVSLAVALSATAGYCATKPAKRVVLGTTQLKGDQAQFGKTYTLGKTAPINVTLNKAEYTVEPVLIGGGPILTNANEKLLVLHYTLHNPNPKDYGLAWSTINIQAVDSNDKNWRYEQNIGMEATGESCNMNLKPAQKTNVYAVIKVPAAGQIPKVIFESRDKLVLRYDLRGKVKPLPAPIADPADTTGATALEKVPGQLGEYYPIRDLHAKIDSVAFSEAPIKGRKLAKGARYLVINGTAKNNLTRKFGFRWSSIKPNLTDVDGGTIRWGDSGIYFASRDDTANAEIEPGQEFRFRFVFDVPEGVQPKTFSMTQGGTSRSYEYDVSGVK